MATLPIQQSFGLIFEERFKALGINATQTALILHLNGTVMSSLGFVSGPLLRKYSYRSVVYAGSLLVTIGVSLTSFAVNIPSMIITYCVLVGMISDANL